MIHQKTSVTEKKKADLSLENGKGYASLTWPGFCINDIIRLDTSQDICRRGRLMTFAIDMASQKGLKDDKDEEQTGSANPAGFQQ